MHAAALAYIAAHLPPDADRVLEFGSRNINGSPRQVCAASYYVGVDVAPGPGADIVADAAAVRVEPALFDAVVCAEVFEHTDNGSCVEMCRNAWEHLGPGGVFVATMAGHGRVEHSAFDGGPLRAGEFYRNVGRDLLSVWLEKAGFDEFSIDVKADDIRCWARRQ